MYTFKWFIQGFSINVCSLSYPPQYTPPCDPTGPVYVIVPFGILIAYAVSTIYVNLSLTDILYLYNTLLVHSL